MRTLCCDSTVVQAAVSSIELRRSRLQFALKPALFENGPDEWELRSRKGVRMTRTQPADRASAATIRRIISKGTALPICSEISARLPAKR